MGQKIERNISSLSHVIIKSWKHDKDDTEVIFSDCHTYLWRYMVSTGEALSFGYCDCGYVPKSVFLSL